MTKYDRIAWKFTLLYIPVLVLISFLSSGCATTSGALTQTVIEQSAAIDTSISDLQSQQATSAGAVQAVTDTTHEIEQTANEIKNVKLSAQVSTLKSHEKVLTDSLSEERSKTTKIQSDYSLYKVTSGTTMVNQSSKINTLTAQLKLSHKWNWILGGIIALFVLASAAIAVLKFYFKKF